MHAEQDALRPVDLARVAGVSTQQIRNYEAAGILPAAARSPSGYRRFDARHRRALLAYRALAQGCGPDGARRILRAVHEGDVPRALALVDAAHAELHEQRRALRETATALAAVAEQPADAAAAVRPAMRIGEVAAVLGVRTSALRVWEAAGLLVPGRERDTGYRRFGAADLRDARMVHLLRQSGYPLPQIRPVLDGLRRTGSSDALRDAITRRDDALTQRSHAMLDGAGYLHHYLAAQDAAPSLP